MTEEDTLFHAECLSWLAAILAGFILMSLADELRWPAFIAILVIGILCGNTADRLHKLRKDLYG